MDTKVTPFGNVTVVFVYMPQSRGLNEEWNRFPGMLNDPSLSHNSDLIQSPLNFLSQPHIQVLHISRAVWRRKLHLDFSHFHEKGTKPKCVVNSYKGRKEPFGNETVLYLHSFVRTYGLWQRKPLSRFWSRFLINPLKPSGGSWECQRKTSHDNQTKKKICHLEPELTLFNSPCTCCLSSCRSILKSFLLSVFFKQTEYFRSSELCCKQIHGATKNCKSLE